MIAQQNLYVGCLLLLKYASAMSFFPFGHLSAFEEGSVRLFGSGLSSEGRVEIYYRGKWGTVCDDGWDMTDANVVCRQLHFTGAKSVVSGTSYGGAPQQIWLDEVGCDGTEERLASCGFRDWGVHDCSHDEDVGVICETENPNSPLQDGSVRLFGSRNSSEGRVEIYHRGTWGTVCDDGWGITNADVVCRQLNFTGAKSVVIGKDYGEATGPIWLDDVSCEGTESRLVSCKFKGWGTHNCDHNEDVGVICDTGSNNMTTSDSPHFLDHSASLADFFGNLFDSGTGCDFLITFQSPNEDIQMDGPPEICAHKLILMQHPFFQPSVETNNITVNVSKSCQPHFTSFIRYLYTHQINVTLSSAKCIHQLALDFGLKQLMEDTGRLLSQILPDDASFNTQVSLYHYAVQTKDTVLEENCVQYLAWNFQNLTTSPSWADLPVELLRALLTRSDLVVPDEFFLHQSLESWITKHTSSISLETQIDLLHLIRVPLIPAEKLQDLKSNSLLYQTHKMMYLESVLKAYEFNVLLFNNHYMNSNFNKDSDDYKPRIYTSETWSTAVNPPDKYTSYQNLYDYYSYSQHYNYNYDRKVVSRTPTTFRTPVHSSLLFRNKTINWGVNLLKTQEDCSLHGERCESVPAVRLKQLSDVSESNILFRNRLLLMCKNKYICQVQGLNDNLTYVPTQALAYPCPDEQYTYMFVVRPDYV